MGLVLGCRAPPTRYPTGAPGQVKEQGTLPSASLPHGAAGAGPSWALSRFNRPTALQLAGCGTHMGGGVQPVKLMLQVGQHRPGSGVKKSWADGEGWAER